MENKIDTTEIVTRNESMLEKVNAFKIIDDKTLEEAGGYLRGIKTFVKEVKAKFDAPKKSAKKTHAEICALEKDCLGPSADAEGIIKGKLSVYVSAQEKIEAERAAKLAAELKAETEKAALALAEDLEKNGQKAEADLALEVAAAPVHVAPVKAKKVEGISYKDVSKFEIVTDDLLPRNCTSGDKKKIKAQIASGVKVIPGVRIWTEKEVAARA